MLNVPSAKVTSPETRIARPVVPLAKSRSRPETPFPASSTTCPVNTQEPGGHWLWTQEGAVAEIRKIDVAKIRKKRSLGTPELSNREKPVFTGFVLFFRIETLIASNEIRGTILTRF